MNLKINIREKNIKSILNKIILNRIKKEILVIIDLAKNYIFSIFNPQLIFVNLIFQ